ncbi:zinc finger FYVE domain-containing protein 26 homolog isoform X2 [Toxorhynchites rutilus septentrionalis]|nr:zinc finger FYVE domain-containing protein 26 homolog isoform X2 [Toxorhynchites rutilus septentrionalis]
MAKFAETFEQENVDKCYNLVANNLLTTDALNRLIPFALQLLEENKIDKENLLLAMVSRKSPKLLKLFLKQMKMTCEQRYLTEIIDDKQHFINNVLSTEDNIFKIPAVRDYIQLFQLMQKMNSGESIGYISSQLDIPKNGCLRDYFLEMKRTQCLQRLLEGRENRPQIEDYAEETSVIGLYLKMKSKITASHYEQIFEAIVENERLNREISGKVCPTETEVQQPRDLKLLQMLMIWQYVIDAMTDSSRQKNSGVTLQSNVNNIKVILKSVNDTQTFIELLESVITLLFVRYEHLPERVFGQVGFICSSIVLEAILNCLKPVATQKKHAVNYDNANDELKQRLTSCLDIINDTLWRLSLFSNLCTTEEASLRLTDIDSGSIIIKVPDVAQEEEDNMFHSVESLQDQSHKYTTLPKRKQTKRRQPSQLSSSGSTGNRFLMQHSLPLPSKIDTVIDSSISAIIPRPKSIFAKIIGSREKLATLCMVSKNIEVAKEIINSGNLSHTAVGQDMIFLENFTQIKSKLSSLTASYDRMRQEQHDGSAGSTLGDIRSSTAIGFEASKIVSTIETFSISQKILQTEEDHQLLEKYIAQYPLLKLFRGDSLRNIYTMDLLLGVPMGYDLNLSMYNLVSKSLHKSKCSDALSFAYVGFLKRLLDDMQMFRTVGSTGRPSVTFHDLLSREVCPLNPVQLKPILEARRDLMTLGSLEDLQLGEGKAPLILPVRIQKFVDEAEKLLGLHTEWKDSLRADDIVRLDLNKIVSELVFDARVPLNVLEPLTNGTNLNLVYIIAKNFLCGAQEKSSFDLLSHGPDVLEYVSKKNQLLGIILKEITNVDGGNSLLKNFKNLSFFDALEPMYQYRMSAALDSDRFDLKQCDVYQDLDDIHRLKLIDSVLGRKQREPHNRLHKLRHEIVTQLLQSNSTELEIPFEKILQNTHDINRKAEYLLKCIDRISCAQTIIDTIRSILCSKHRGDLTGEHEESLKEWLFKLQIYVEIGEALDNRDWRSIHHLSENSMDQILLQLMLLNLLDLCSRWISVHSLKCDKYGEFHDIFTLAVTRVAAEQQDCSTLFTIIEGMPKGKVIRFYETVLSGVKNESVIEHAVGYLEQFGENHKTYQRHRISLKIFSHLPVGGANRPWNLISRPLLIIEQYLMNSKLELLAIVMDSIRPLLKDHVCQQCFEQREYIRDLRNRLNGSIDLDSSHDDQFITNECIDCLLRIYAGKALDYRVSNDSGTSGESMHDQSMNASSLDSLCGAFVMPKGAPTKDEWVRDEEATLCMCCRRSVFSMLNRRHHCRRCGRVVCHSCSKRKLQIPELYENVPVRACDDCVRQTEAKSNVQAQSSAKPSGPNSSDEWQLTGNVRNDNIIREEYSYEYAPSTSQCLAICNLHSQNEEISSFLLYHCAKLESLLRPIHPGYPNPEIDYALVARMLLNLTLAAKVRGIQFSEADKVKEHAEIILSIVNNDCESLLLQESMSSANLRKLRDALVKAEKWTLALELSLKGGFATSGVMAAWGTTSLRAGCYETAREKFSHCLQKLSTDADNSTILNCIESPETKLASYSTAIPIKRPTKSPPLLLEIISILESTAQAQPPEVIARASLIKSSNTSLSSIIRKKSKENIPLHEPALNVLNTLSSLKHITKGNFTDFLPEKRAARIRDPAASATTATGSAADYLHALDCIMSTRFFEESMYYLLTYGAHQDITNFLTKHRQILPAMKYSLMQQVDPEVFLQTIVLPYLRNGRLETIIQLMSGMDETLLSWKDYIIHTCRYLETNQMLNCLYNVQLLLRDPIRASMTCVRFYSMGAKNFTDLETNTFHLKNSVAHLQAELELCNWEEVSVDSYTNRGETHKSLLMKMEPRELNNHINTILRQLELSKFLSNCEARGKDVMGLLLKLFVESTNVPTLFGTVHEKLQLAVLVLVCGQNIEEGFGLSYRVIQDFNLNSLRVYGLTAKYFINNSQVEEVEKLIQAIVSNSSVTVDTHSFCDELIKNSVEATISVHGNSSQVKTALEALIKRISDVGLKVHCYVVTGQLKTAYLLANKHGRIGDIRKILRQAELLNQVHVKRLCETKLATESGSKK